MHSNANPVAPSFPGGVVYLQSPLVAAGSQIDGYRHKQSVGLGAAQLALGCLCIVFNCISLGLNTYYGGLSFVGHGIWCGVLVWNDSFCFVCIIRLFKDASGSEIMSVE